MKIYRADDVSLSKWIAEASQAVNKIKSGFSLCRTLAVSDAMAGHGRLSLPAPTLGYCQTQPPLVDAPTELKVRSVHREGAKQVTVQGGVKQLPRWSPSIDTRSALLKMK